MLEFSLSETEEILRGTQINLNFDRLRAAIWTSLDKH